MALEAMHGAIFFINRFSERTYIQGFKSLTWEKDKFFFLFFRKVSESPSYIIVVPLLPQNLKVSSCSFFLLKPVGFVNNFFQRPLILAPLYIYIPAVIIKNQAV